MTNKNLESLVLRDKFDIILNLALKVLMKIIKKFVKI